MGTGTGSVFLICHNPSSVPLLGSFSSVSGFGREEFLFLSLDGALQTAAGFVSTVRWRCTDHGCNFLSFYFCPMPLFCGEDEPMGVRDFFSYY